VYGQNSKAVTASRNPSIGCWVKTYSKSFKSGFGVRDDFLVCLVCLDLIRQIELLHKALVAPFVETDVVSVRPIETVSPEARQWDYTESTSQYLFIKFKDIGLCEA
jgi:hypothetical protein